MSTYLVHHGILGQRWGVRRFQNPDGSLTKAGKKRYAKETMKALKKNKDQQQRIALDMGTAAVGLGGMYYELTGNSAIKNGYYEEHRKALEEGRLVVNAIFKEDYSDGSVTGSVDGVPISKIKIDPDGNLISEIFDEDILYAQADFLDYIDRYEKNKNKTKEEPVERIEVDWEDLIKGDKARNEGKLSSKQKEVAEEIARFEPSTTTKRFKSADDALDEFNKQYHEKFGDIDLMAHQELLDAYDYALNVFLETHYSEQ